MSEWYPKRVAELAAELAQLRELYADRERDVAFEYACRMALDAEVDRLRGELAFDAHLAPIDSAEIVALRAEVARLREALERVSKIYPTRYVKDICDAALAVTR